MRVEVERVCGVERRQGFGVALAARAEDDGVESRIVEEGVGSGCGSGAAGVAGEVAGAGGGGGR